MNWICLAASALVHLILLADFFVPARGDNSCMMLLAGCMEVYGKDADKSQNKSRSRECELFTKLAACFNVGDCQNSLGVEKTLANMKKELISRNIDCGFTKTDKRAKKTNKTSCDAMFTSCVNTYKSVMSSIQSKPYRMPILEIRNIMMCNTVTQFIECSSNMKCGLTEREQQDVKQEVNKELTKSNIPCDQENTQVDTCTAASRECGKTFIQAATRDNQVKQDADLCQHLEDFVHCRLMAPCSKNTQEKFISDTSSQIQALSPNCEISYKIVNPNSEESLSSDNAHNGVAVFSIQILYLLCLVLLVCC
ncbi:uncharacterized protein LOC131932044 [Physella acuta]|uniref:uncharacterized protein LOC131932044 n=1 Tax=Physella acuta TaxID=109671 RepID=UPI0027DCF428|nr:uncharacterized protein LOC131932044 [Physella acuta]